MILFHKKKKNQLALAMNIALMTRRRRLKPWQSAMQGMKPRQKQEAQVPSNKHFQE